MDKTLHSQNIMCERGSPSGKRGIRFSCVVGREGMEFTAQFRWPRSSSNTCSYCVSEWAVQGAVVLGALGEESRSGVSLLQILKCPWENEDRLGGRARGICHGQSRVTRHLVIPTYLPPILQKNPQLENLKCWPVSHPLV